MPSPRRFKFTPARNVCVFLMYCAVFSARCQTPGLRSFETPSAVHSTALELILDKPYVSVMVNGKGPFRFLVDTGTGGQALITPALAEQLLLPVVGRAHLKDPSGIGEQRSEIASIDSLKIAGVEFSDVEATVHNLYNDSNCQGVLGFTLFEDYLLTLDFPGRKMVLTEGDIDEGSGGSVLPFRMPDGVPIVTLNIGEREFEAQIDSGGTGLSVPQKNSGELRFQETPVAFASGESVATKFEIKAARLQTDVRLGRFTFKQAFVELNSAFPLVNIGSTPLKHFVITFDQINDQLRIYSSQEILRLDASPSSLQLLHEQSPQKSDNKLIPIG